MELIKVSDVHQTCQACPSQWEGITGTNLPIYARYRFGRLTVELDELCIFDTEIGDSLDGIIDYTTLKKYTGHMILWP